MVCYISFIQSSAELFLLLGYHITKSITITLMKAFYFQVL